MNTAERKALRLTVELLLHCARHKLHTEDVIATVRKAVAEQYPIGEIHEDTLRWQPSS